MTKKDANVIKLAIVLIRSFLESKEFQGFTKEKKSDFAKQALSLLDTLPC